MLGREAELGRPNTTSLGEGHADWLSPTVAPCCSTSVGYLTTNTTLAYDPEANVLFMIRVVCRLCGYTMLFDSEQHHHGDEQTLFQGPPELEDELDPPDS